jgi:diguanylate cyclase (GGDEF)-like protein
LSLPTAVLETRALADLANLSASSHDYVDLVRIVLDQIEYVVDSPVLGLSLQESQRIGHYVRMSGDVESGWGKEARHHFIQVHTRWLEEGPPDRVTAYQHGMAAWFLAFPAKTRSGRAGILSLGAPEPIVTTPDEEALMLRVVRQVVLVLDHALLLEEMEGLESVDRLTGTLSHRRLLEVLDYEMKRHRHEGKRLTLILLDVEELASINRNYGRSYGDHILKKMASVLQNTVRPIDVVARYGLDEFAVIAPEADEEEGQEMAERLREEMLSLRFAGGQVGVSVGMARLKPGEALTAEDFLRRGEQTLHQVKQQERSRSALWESTATR